MDPEILPVLKNKASDFKLIRAVFNEKEFEARSSFLNSLWAFIEKGNFKNIDKYQKVILTLVSKNLKRCFKEKKAIEGPLEFKLMSENPALRVLRAKWARRRGLSFEKKVFNYLKTSFISQDLPAFVYRNIAQFSFQPYDLGIFSKYTRPILIECKRSGFDFSKHGPYLNSCTRRYKCFKKNFSKIKETILKAGVPAYFCYGGLELKNFYLVSFKKVVAALDQIETKNFYLNQNDFKKVSFDQVFTLKDLVSLQSNFYAQ